ncbi:hypothetical protein NQ315_011071 [Exocentrus adspersus]|uniref:Uncharacterized protein n=1 Tax=Exocentrus adspersus TaxID=1586481 RepID=A0AAV8VY26_9CUCU|nr:hypothetical protein NQ315_011071 [Exocentrus adspersus]
MKRNLISFHIIERESDEQNLITWTYPTITEDLTKHITTRCFPLRLADKGLFFYLLKNNLWIYIKNFIHKEKSAAVIVIAQELAPPKYKLLCEIFVNNYIRTNNPVELVKLYIKSVSMDSICYQENGSEYTLDLKKVTNNAKVKDLINDFGLHTVLIYNAILLKRRTLVYHPDIERLQEKLFAITYLVPNRNPKEYLHPYTGSISELKGIPFFVAGTAQENVLVDQKSFDLHVNLQDKEITLSKIAQENFVLSKVDKDMAQFLVQLSKSDYPDEKVVEEINNRTDGLFQQLHSIAVSIDGKKMLTMDNLKSRKYNPALETFLFNLAVAENMMMF